jgi:hypothetical protein
VIPRTLRGSCWPLAAMALDIIHPTNAGCLHWKVALSAAD